MRLTGANTLMGHVEGDFDGHAHVFHADLPMAPVRRYRPAYDAPMLAYERLLRASRLDGAILVQPSFLGTDNRFLLETLETARRESPLIFRGVVVLDPIDPAFLDGDFSTLDALSAAGIIGLRLNLIGQFSDGGVDRRDWRPLLRAASDRGWHAELHCEGARLVSTLRALLECCETVVVDHFGRPGEDPGLKGQQILLTSPRDRLFIKASAPYRVFPDVTPNDAAIRCADIVRRMLDRFGPKRMLWGSDWPWTQFEGRHSYAACVAWRDRWLQRAP